MSTSENSATLRDRATDADRQLTLQIKGLIDQEYQNPSAAFLEFVAANVADTGTDTERLRKLAKRALHHFLQERAHDRAFRVVDHGKSIVLVFACPAIQGLHNLDSLGDHMNDAVESYPGIEMVVIDFSDVSHISSFGLGVMLDFWKKCSAAALTVRLCGLSPRIRELFTVCKLDQIFDIRETREEALADL